MDASVPDILAAEARYWDALPTSRGDENVAHVSDLTSCRGAVWLRRTGAPQQPTPLKTRRQWAMGHVIEDAIAHAIEEGLRHDGWMIERDVLVWLSHTDVLPEDARADWFSQAHPEGERVVQRHESGLLGGPLGPGWSNCARCACSKADHDEYGVCRAHIAGGRDGYCTCATYTPNTANVPETIMVGHADIVCRKAWACVVLENKSKGEMFAKDFTEPNASYVTQNVSYAFALGARMFAPMQVCRRYGSFVFGKQGQWYDTREHLYSLAETVRDRLLTTAPARAKELPDLDPPENWSCKRNKDGVAYCRFSTCPKHPDYLAPTRGFTI